MINVGPWRCAAAKASPHQDCLAESNRRTGIEPAGTGPSRGNGSKHLPDELMQVGRGTHVLRPTRVATPPLRVTLANSRTTRRDD